MTKKYIEDFIDTSNGFSPELQAIAEFLVEAIKHLDSRTEDILRTQKQLEEKLARTEEFLSMLVVNYNPIFELDKD